MGTDARHPPADDLLERERELAALARLIDAAADGQGRIALIEGPAGIGKSRLLAEARDRASAGGRMQVLSARCGELERDFSFGVVRQLFEDGRPLSGAASPAAGVLGAPTDGDAADGSFAVLHGLYWATLERAEERPLLLAIDDLQWSDRPSLRFVAYLARRLEGLPVLVVATLRSTDPGTDPALIAEIAADPLCEAIRPGPLGDDAVAAMVRGRLGADADARFCAACQEATGGNPLLLRQLLSALADDGVAPVAARAAAVREIGPRAVARTVLRRLARLPGETVAVARAVATLGESASMPAVAALTELDEPVVAGAAGALARADILRPDPPLGFDHPLVRDAVYRDQPAGERELSHARAATALARLDAPAEEIAAQLLHAPARGDGATVELLRAAAARAQQRGAPESAVAYLARALEEPPPRELRAAVLLELGIAEAGMNAPSAVEHLRAAHGAVEDAATRATIAGLLAQSLLFTGGMGEGGALARATAGELGPELADQAWELRAIELLSLYFGARDHGALARAAAYTGLPADAGPGARAYAIAVAFSRAVGDTPPAEAERLALAALGDGELLTSGHGLAWSCALVALTMTGSAHADDLVERARAEAYRRGSTFETSSAEMFGGWHLYLKGELDEAAESLRHAFRLQVPWGSDAMGRSWSRGLLALCELTRGDVAAAQAAMGAVPADDDGSDGANLWRTARCELLLDEGRAEEALALARVMGELSPQVVHPDWKPWRSLAARALARLGDDRRAEAAALLEQELAAARAYAADATAGRVLRQLGELETGAAAGATGAAGAPATDASDAATGVDRLRAAAELLATTPARLEHARALAALGGALRRGGHPADAREPLRAALELAEACGCPPLVEQVRSELYAAGARPRTTALGGAAALTARERRVAGLAADGATNREIAQVLFVTPKTVEVHLSSAYRKLDIRSRRDLPAALASA